MKLRKMQQQERDFAANKFAKSVETGDMLVRVAEAEAEVFRMRNKMKEKEQQIREIKLLTKNNT